MIRAIIVWLLGAKVEAERKRILMEARSILAEAKERAQRQYVQFDPIDLSSSAFLYGIQPILGNRFMISWLLRHKENCIQLMKQAMAANDKDKALNGLAQITMIDSLFMDLEGFGDAYKAMLESKKDAA